MLIAREAQGTRIPVWLLVHYRRLGLSDAELLQQYPTLSAQALADAWDYAATHPDEIKRAILVNG